MKIKSKHWKIFPIIIILYSHRILLWEFKRTSNTYYLIFFFFVVCKAESHIVPFLQNRKVLMETKFPLPENISLSLYSGSWSLPNLHKSSTCSFIYSSFHIFCKIVWQSNYVLSTMLGNEDKITLEKVPEKRGETCSPVDPGSKLLSCLQLLFSN